MHRYWIDQLRKTQKDLEDQIERLRARNDRVVAERDRLARENDQLKYRLRCIGEDPDETRVR